MTNVAKSTASFTVGTGITFALCHELDEILVQEGKDPYFVPGMKGVIKSMGAEEAAKKFLSKLGIRDRIDTSNSKSITDYLKSMSEADKRNFEAATGQSVKSIIAEQELLNEQIIQNQAKQQSVTAEIMKYVNKEDPFNTGRK